jgi:hypothetical protein
VRRLLGIALLLGLGFGSAGCFALPNTGPTAVSRSELYEPGEPEYDAFFEKLHDVQQTVVATSNEQHALERALASELGLDPLASRELVATRFDKRLAEIESNKSKLKIELIGIEEGDTETDAIVSLTDASGAEQSNSFTKTLAEIAKRTAKLSVKVRKTIDLTTQLSQKLPTLEAQVDDRFRLLGPMRTKETHRNLTDARLALPSLRQALGVCQEDTDGLITLLKKASPKEKTAAAPKPKPHPKPTKGGGASDYEP